MSTMCITLISLLILIQPSYSQVISVICTETSPCECTDETTKCKLKCQQDDTCFTPPGYILQCAPNQACDIDCIGNNTCSNALVMAHDATDLFISCKYGIAPCVGTTIYCGSGHCSIRCKLTAPGSCVGINIVPGNALSFECLGSCPQSLLDAGFSAAPTAVTLAPSTSPTLAPSQAPSSPPSAAPTTSPSAAPTNNPSMSPSSAPTHNPSNAPTSYTNKPSFPPTRSPVTNAPTENPVTSQPSVSPTNVPTMSPLEELEVFEPIITTTKGTNTKNTQEDELSVGQIDGTTMIMTAAVAVVGCCILVGAIILCRKKKEATDNEADYAAKQALDIDKDSDEDQKVHINVQPLEQIEAQASVPSAEGNVKHAKYLSNAQKQQFSATVKGPRTDDSDEYQERENEVDHNAQEMKRLTPGVIAMENIYNAHLDKEVSTSKVSNLSDDDDVIMKHMTPGMDDAPIVAAEDDDDISQLPNLVQTKSDGTEISELSHEFAASNNEYAVKEMDDDVIYEDNEEYEEDDEYDVQYDDDDEQYEEEIVEDEEYADFETQILTIQ